MEEDYIESRFQTGSSHPMMHPSSSHSDSSGDSTKRITIGGGKTIKGLLGILLATILLLLIIRLIL